MDKTRTIKIDPKMFINEPFILCPNCKQKEFGVLTINAYSYVRRCRNCRHDETYKLPSLKKKIIYIDQFAISDMMKSINLHVGKMDKVDPFFKALFEKLDRLNKLQLINCPDSQNHFNESLVSPYYKALKRMYEQLSNGTTFYDAETIKRFEITNNFYEWLGEKRDPLSIEDILMGDNIDGWQDHFIISVSLRDQNPQLAIDIRSERDKTSTELEQIFKRWQTEKTKTFEQWYQEECSSFGKAILNNYIGALVDYENLVNKSTSVSSDTLSSLLSSASVTITYINQKLREKGLSDEAVLEKTCKYFLSEKIKEIPYLKISASLFAALAREASLGRKKPPTKGMLNDIEVIAAYAPFCDALFVDNECRRLADLKEAQTKYDLSSKVFSRDNKEAFLAFLDQIEKDATKEHLDLVNQVYGEEWSKPFVEMFKNPEI